MLSWPDSMSSSARLNGGSLTFEIGLASLISLRHSERHGDNLPSYLSIYHAKRGVCLFWFSFRECYNPACVPLFSFRAGQCGGVTSPNGVIKSSIIEIWRSAFGGWGKCSCFIIWCFKLSSVYGSPLFGWVMSGVNASLQFHWFISTTWCYHGILSMTLDNVSYIVSEIGS